MQTISLLFTITLVVFSSLSCRNRDPETSTTSAAEIINAGSKGIYVIRPFNEVWAKKKNEAVNIAFDMVTEEVKKRFPKVDINGGVEFFKQRVDMRNVEDGAKRFLEANLEDIEGVGMDVNDVIPSAFMFVFSGPILEKLLAERNLPVQTDVLLTLIVVPKFVQRYVPGKKEVMESWRFHFGAGLMTFARLKSGSAAVSQGSAAAKTALRVGMGFVWGPVDKPSDLSGKLAGVAMSRSDWRVPGTAVGGKIPFGNNAKVFALSSSKNGWIQDENGEISVFKVTNILATFEYIFSETKYNYIHPYVGVSWNSDQLLSYFLGVTELPSEEQPSDGSVTPPVKDQKQPEQQVETNTPK